MGIMISVFARAVALCAIALLTTSTVSADSLGGTFESAGGSEWQSAWLNLVEPETFRKNDRLSITLGGDAENVVVRLLPKGAKADSEAGREGLVRKVPPDRVLVVVLTRNHPEVTQI